MPPTSWTARIYATYYVEFIIKVSFPSFPCFDYWIVLVVLVINLMDCYPRNKFPLSQCIWIVTQSQKYNHSGFYFITISVATRLCHRQIRHLGTLYKSLHMSSHRKVYNSHIKILSFWSIENHTDCKQHKCARQTCTGHIDPRHITPGITICKALWNQEHLLNTQIMKILAKCSCKQTKRSIQILPSSQIYACRHHQYPGW